MVWSSSSSSYPHSFHTLCLPTPTFSKFSIRAKGWSWVIVGNKKKLFQLSQGRTPWLWWVVLYQGVVNHVVNYMHTSNYHLHSRSYALLTYGSTTPKPKKLSWSQSFPQSYFVWQISKFLIWNTGCQYNNREYLRSQRTMR